MQKKDKEAARTTLAQFDAYAQTGQPLIDFYDKKKCHEAFSFTLSPPPQHVKVIRIWGTGAIRVYFLYGSDKRIILLKVAPKRSDSLSVGDKLEIQERATEVIKGLESRSFEERMI